MSFCSSSFFVFTVQYLGNCFINRTSILYLPFDHLIIYDNFVSLSLVNMVIILSSAFRSLLFFSNFASGKQSFLSNTDFSFISFSFTQSICSARMAASDRMYSRVRVMSGFLLLCMIVICTLLSLLCFTFIFHLMRRFFPFLSCPSLLSLESGIPVTLSYTSLDLYTVHAQSLPS